ncbi:hypothetical protein ACIGG6_04440 [Vreelandella lionensis]|uniref:Rad50/SbcC-type AAA domain-containing protein n=1 Tax=Vreelandella lionensis TaxID=1144478 RepID=A0ABW8BSP2_9GAMM
MVITSLVANNVYGYLNFNINFNKDISFLVGSNGSGKTTALKLVNALVTPNFKELLETPFDDAYLFLEQEGEHVMIYACEENGNIVLRVNTVEGELILPSYSSGEFEYFAHREDKINELIDEVTRKYADHPIVKEISKIDSPIFLGLDRRREEIISSKNDYYYERGGYLTEKNKRSVRARRLIKGSIGVSLMETELLIQQAYRRLREAEERHSSRLRDKILLSVFQYTNFESEDFRQEGIVWKERSRVLERKKEIAEALANIGLNDSSLSQEVDNFFQSTN